jgi:hypothetical protein
MRRIAQNVPATLTAREQAIDLRRSTSQHVDARCPSGKPVGSEGELSTVKMCVDPNKVAGGYRL